MSTNNISPSIFGNSTSPAWNGDNLTKADAWRKALDKEQGEILKDIKSVKLGNTYPSSTDDSKFMTDSHADEHHALEARPSENKPQTLQEQTLSQSTYKTFQNPGASSIQQTKVLPTPILLSFREGQNALFHGSIPYTDLNAEETLSAVALFESHFKQKWPLKNVHLMQTEKGVRVWIRDLNLSTGSTETQILVDRIKQALKTDNQELVGVVLNGKTVF